LVLAANMQSIKRDWNLYNLRLVNRAHPLIISSLQ